MKRIGVFSVLLLWSLSPAQTPSACDPGLRSFDHEFLMNGPLCIPETPSRIAFLTNPSYIYSFGVKPAGSWGMERDAANFPVIADWIVNGITDIGLPPDLETLTKLDPDLMILPEEWVTEIVDELPLIAPTALYQEAAPWRDRHRFFGAVLGQEAEAEAQLAVVDTRIEELREALTGKLGDVSRTTVGVLRVRAAGEYNLLTRRNLSVEVVEDVGFSLPAAVVDSTEEFSVDLTDESVPLAASDVLLLIGATGGAGDQTVEGNALIEGMMGSPLWNTLDAFKNDQVHIEPDYFLQANLLTAHQVIDELTHVFEVETATPNPFAQKVTAP